MSIVAGVVPRSTLVRDSHFAKQYRPIAVNEGGARNEVSAVPARADSPRKVRCVVLTSSVARSEQL